MFALEYILHRTETEQTGSSPYFHVALSLFIRRDQRCLELFSSAEKIGFFCSRNEGQERALSPP